LYPLVAAFAMFRWLCSPAAEFLFDSQVKFFSGATPIIKKIQLVAEFSEVQKFICSKFSLTSEAALRFQVFSFDGSDEILLEDNQDLQALDYKREYLVCRLAPVADVSSSEEAQGEEESNKVQGGPPRGNDGMMSLLQRMAHDKADSQAAEQQASGQLLAATAAEARALRLGKVGGKTGVAGQSKKADGGVAGAPKVTTPQTKRGVKGAAVARKQNPKSELPAGVSPGSADPRSAPLDEAKAVDRAEAKKQSKMTKVKKDDDEVENQPEVEEVKKDDDKEQRAPAGPGSSVAVGAAPEKTEADTAEQAAAATLAAKETEDVVGSGDETSGDKALYL
jgi:hypothetical protein